MMNKCPICGREYENGRQLHGHMLKAHQEEYRKAGNRVANMVNDQRDPIIDKILHTIGGRPHGFRLLDKSDPVEREAYSVGYRFVDGEYFYTADEAKEKGWI